jgi:tricorn protease-like protein/C-terminal processing protease CtpA/Prc
MSMARTSLASLFLALAYAAPAARAQVAPHAGMLRYPDVSAGEVVFVYADDLWIVGREGGVARPLASPEGLEAFPRFSPDGKSIVFLGNYEGNPDLYVLPVEGGVPRRITHHPAPEFPSEWTPDGRVIFYTNGLAGNPRQVQLFTVGAQGGMPERLPVPYGAMGAISPNGEWLAYTPHTTDNRTWKRYVGGMATDVWLFNLRNSSSRRVTDWPGTDTQPMWHRDMLYYLSDEGQDGRLNLWSWDPATARREPLTRYADFDVKWPAIGPGPDGRGEIVFQHGAELVLMSLANKGTTALQVTIPGARPNLGRRMADFSEQIVGADPSPSAKRVLIEARGDVWSVPAEKGSARNLTRTSGIAERSPAWSPDGRWIAWLSDRTGEYELWLSSADGKGEPRQLTSDGAVWRDNLAWSPDSKYLSFGDKTGALYVHVVDSGETRWVETDPWRGDAPPPPSWSHDSRWLAFERADDASGRGRIVLYELESGGKHVVTSGFFDDGEPVFDRKGDWLFFRSNRSFQPTYSDLDTTFVYRESGVLLGVPLRGDVKSPWLAKSDEEPAPKDDEKAEKGSDDGEEKADEKADEKSDEESDEKAEEAGDEEEGDEDAEDDGISGTWEGTCSGPPPAPPGSHPISFVLHLGADGALTGSASALGATIRLESGSWNAESGALEAELVDPDGVRWTISARVEGETMKGRATGANGMAIDFEVKRTKKAGEDAGEDEKDEDKPREKVEVELEGFEARALAIPVPNGSLRNLRVNDKGHLMYLRASAERGDGGRGGGGATIQIFDLEDEKKEEKTVLKGANAFGLTPDGKKMLVSKGDTLALADATANATEKPLDVSGLKGWVDPREEWEQMLRETWRLYRDYFYDANLHGVDWDAVHQRYQTMLPDCASRRDLAYVISEMISELNVGHAYYSGGDTGENGPSVSVGLLGCVFERADEGYKIGRILRPGPWDTDAASPLSAPGLEVSEGDWLLAVNGVPLDPAQDPWAAFLNLAGKTVTLTVGPNPTLDDQAREVVVTTLSSDQDLRYRAWVEEKRTYVERKSGGKVAYVHVPDTGVNGQNELVRQYYAQTEKPALIVDERWNGGGQIPTRFIEMLDRPITNYWARRDGKDWPWPPDAHQGPKCMLINGLSGSGGDAFPWYFKQRGLGKLIGMRTWGGLVGLSGNPRLIDGASVTVPRFAFYETDGTWGVEGHGVDPDIEVIDDPALMVDGSDPQLDAAIERMLTELETNPYRPPQRPAGPDRSGIGVTEADK